MYLADRDLENLLGELQFSTDDPNHPFVPGEQIQPCSIDLRLDRVFWRQRRRSWWPWHFGIDLRNARLLEMEPRRHWNKSILQPNQGITLKPGEMILGRTYEKFRIPPAHAGKLEGRSSFARMGLAIHCSADFINPGYGGHMPLQLINHGKTAIVLFPYIPICQLIVIRLSSESRRLYGDRELHSKYLNDDGGPSYWWRDKRIKKLHNSLESHAISHEIQNEILELIGRREPELISRFEIVVGRLGRHETTNADEILDRFAKAEDRAFRLATLVRYLMIWAGPAMLTVFLGVLFRGSSIVAMSLAGALLLIGWLITLGAYFLGNPPGEYLTHKELERLRRDHSV